VVLFRFLVFANSLKACPPEEGHPKEAADAQHWQTGGQGVVKQALS